MSIKLLSDLKPGQKGTVVKVRGSGRIRHRLFDMGLVTQAQIGVERVAPLGDPIGIKIKGYHLSLRKEEAINIAVEVNEE